MILALLVAIALPKSGTVELPHGDVAISTELRLPDGAHDVTIQGNQTTLRVTPGFRGRAVVSCRNCRNIVLRDFTIDGNRAALEKPISVAPSDQSFAAYYRNNGVLFEQTDGLVLDRVRFRNITNFAVIVNASKNVLLTGLEVSDSGSRNANHRNNTSGGVLLEEGTEAFTVTDSTFRNIRGNAVWTHSRYGSPRNRSGRISNNRFSESARDAIQVGHASQVLVAGNSGKRIGYPEELIDLEARATPVAIDTAGNVDQTTYEKNTFEEIDGKCIDLDGFHDGIVRGNTCINRGKPEDYFWGHYGIVFNNSNIDMQSRNILVEDNTLEGMKFGGIFIIGTGHRILRNHMSRLNTAHCNENAKKFGCSVLDEPHVLDSGIYLGSHADRPAPASGNIVEGNTIGGWKMKMRCIQAAPGVKLSDNTIRNNVCTDE